MNMRIEMIPISDLVPYANNAKRHNEKQVEAIAASIREFGFCSVVLIGASNEIIAGHGRVLGAKLAGVEKVPCFRLGHLTENQRRALMIADNRLAETGGGWDIEKLRLEVENIDWGSLAEFDLDEMDFNSLFADSREFPS